MFGDKILQTITSLGTVTYTTATTAVAGWKTWRARFASGAVVFYYAESDDGTVWEYGYGTLTHVGGGADTVTRNLAPAGSSTGSLIDWQASDGPIYLYSVPMALAFAGRYDTANTLFVPSGRRPFTAKGAANYTLTADDVAGRFSFDPSAASRTMTLPAGSTVGMGYSVGALALSDAFPLIVAPNGTDAIDFGAAGASRNVGQSTYFEIFWDGSRWRTTLPAASVPSVTTLTSGTSATYNTPAGVRRLHVRMVGAGGGGGATGASTAPAGGTGGTTTFNAVNANGGVGGTGSFGAAGPGGIGGTGGTGSASLRIPGGGGTPGSASSTYIEGGNGGDSQFGQGGRTAGTSTGLSGTNASANTGGGGTGGGFPGTTQGSGGGGSGEYVELWIANPAATYTYTVGNGGSAGVGTGAGATTGGIGGSGLIFVTAYFD